MNRDVMGGLALLVIAGLYYAAMGQIADSSLSDAVGAAGLPRMLALFLAIIGLVLTVRGLLAYRAARAERQSLATASAGVGEQIEAAEEDEDDDSAPLPRALGLLMFGVAYVAILPFAGYLLSVALLIGGVALYEGAARTWRVPVLAVGGAVFYWLVFVKLLAVHQPTGLFFSGLLS